MKITQPIYDDIKKLTACGQLESITFAPYHKGLDISINDKYKNKEYEILEDQLGDLFYGNEFETGGSFYPIIKDDILKFNVIFEYNLKDFNSAEDNWIFSDLINLLESELKEILGSDIDPDSLNLNVEMTSQIGDEKIVQSYILIYTNPETLVELDISNKDEIKNKIINYTHEWSINNLYHTSNNDFNFLINIDDSRLFSFIEYYSDSLELEIVEHFY